MEGAAGDRVRQRASPQRPAGLCGGDDRERVLSIEQTEFLPLSLLAS